MPGSESDGLFLSALSYFTAPGIGLFFMISGALLLPVKTDTRTFLRRRFSKIAIPTFVWSVLFLGIKAMTTKEPFSWKALFSIPFTAQGNPSFWFLYALMGLYLLAPVISHWLNAATRQELAFYLLLWGLSLCFPLLQLVLDINTSATGILYYFTGYAGYFVLGHYMKTYPDRIQYKWLIPAVIAALVAPVVCKVKGLSVDFYSVFWYLSIFVVIQCVFLWKLVFSLVPEHGWPSINRVISKISVSTFGIYLVHFFIIRSLLWNWSPILAIQPYFLQVFVIAAAAFFLSFGVTFLIGKIPGAQYLIGQKI
jgi:surface polysaccharide O-acyltransferase-like enzyme